MRVWIQSTNRPPFPHKVRPCLRNIFARHGCLSVQVATPKPSNVERGSPIFTRQADNQQATWTISPKGIVKSSPRAVVLHSRKFSFLLSPLCNFSSFPSHLIPSCFPYPTSDSNRPYINSEKRTNDSTDAFASEYRSIILMEGKIPLPFKCFFHRLLV